MVARAEIASMLGVSQRRTTQLTNGPGFPEPIAVLTVGRVWSTEQVRAWAAGSGRTLHPLPRS